MGIKQYNDKKTTIPKTNNSNTLNRKELLMKEFVTKTTVSKKSNITISKSTEITSENNDSKNNILKLKERIKVLEKQILLHKERNKKLNSQSNIGKSKIDKYYSLYIKIKEESDREILDINKKLDKSEERYNELKSYSSKYEDIIQSLKQEIENLKTQNDKLSKSKMSMQGVLCNKNLSYMETTEENKRLVEEINSLNKTIKYSTTTIKNLEFDKALLINRIELLENLNKAYANSKLGKDKPEYKIITFIYYSLKKVHENILNSIKFRYYAHFKRNNKLSEDTYGKIQKTLFGYKVVDFTTNNSYNVVEFRNKQNITKYLDGYACAFRINRRNRAIVTSVFKNIESLKAYKTRAPIYKDKRSEK